VLTAGAIERMIQAKDIEQKGILLGKAISIVAGLQASLNSSKSADVTKNLDMLSDSMQRRLL
jgi:flagellar secretion chaperone FliS